jgi:ketosteroid isomerase-like protein
MEGSGKTDLERVKETYADWGRGDFSGGADVFDSEMTAENFGMGAPIQANSYEEFLDVMRDWLSASERPIRIAAEDYIESGDRILALVHWQGRGKGSGAEIESRGAHLWFFRDGRCVRFETYRDRAEGIAALERG